MSQRTLEIDNAPTGVVGLDDILSGGFSRGALFLIEGKPGTGKTTLALRFLIEGDKAGEPTLYITLSETKDELLAGAASHGWDVGNIEVFELQQADLEPKNQQSLLYSADLELGETVKLILDAVEGVKPSRVVLDSLSEIRLLAQSSLRYRRQLLALKHHFAKRRTTVVVLDDLTAEALDKTAHSIAHGVVRLEETATNFGAERRRMRVSKYRGRRYRGGYHDFTISTGGLQIFPRLVSGEHHADFDAVVLSSGNPELDKLLGGGLEKGSTALALGPAGAGKSALVLQFALAAVARGEKVAIFVFDEELNLLFRRMMKMGVDLKKLRRQGSIIFEQVDAAQLSPGEFAHKVRRCVEVDGVQTVVIDSLNGYQEAMPEEQLLVLHMHELLQFLNRLGVSTFLTVAQHGLVGDMKSPVDVTYLADTVILIRYFEAHGKVRRAISVVKKRTGPHEDSIRELKVTSHGLVIGEALHQFHGILRGSPTFTGSSTPLISDEIT